MRNKDEIEGSIARLIEVLKSIDKITAADTGLSSGEIQEVARVTAEQARGDNSSSASFAPPSSIFIVHGRDTQFLNDVETHVKSLGITPIVLSKMPNAGQMSLLAKFLKYGQLAEFAIVLISPDDYGVLFDTYNTPGVGTQALQFRARQNVILELGFFYGQLGFDKVFVLFKPSQQPFPYFEFPSDIGAIPFDTYDATGNWRLELRSSLKTAGFAIP